MGQAYQDISPQKTQSFLKLIEKNDNNQSFNKESVKMMSQYLAFMPDYERLVCEDYSTVPNQVKHYLRDAETIYPMLYSVDPWMDNDFGNKNLDLNTQNIASYVRFYFDYFINGSDTLKPIRFTDDITWQDEISPSIRQSMEKELLHYPEIEQKNENFLIKMPCVFRQSIMTVTFNIDPQGRIDIEKRESMIDDLPIKHLP